MNFALENTQLLLNYWHKLRSNGDGEIPCWGDFDPSEMKSILPDLILHDLRKKDDSYIRLMGTNITKRTERDITGQSYLLIVPPERHEKAIYFLDTSADHPCGMHVLMRVEDSYGQDEYFEALGLPYSPRERDLSLDFPDRPFLLFSIFCIEDHKKSGLDEYNFKDFTEIVERNFIDLGFGTPDMN